MTGCVNLVHCFNRIAKIVHKSTLKLNLKTAINTFHAVSIHQYTVLELY